MLFNKKVRTVKYAAVDDWNKGGPFIQKSFSKVEAAKKWLEKTRLPYRLVKYYPENEGWYFFADGSKAAYATLHRDYWIESCYDGRLLATTTTK